MFYIDFNLLLHYMVAKSVNSVCYLYIALKLKIGLQHDLKSVVDLWKAMKYSSYL
jgi:hypothetical protein